MKTDGNEMTDMNGEIRTGELQPGTVLNEKYRVEKAAGRCALYNMYEGRELDSGRKVMIRTIGPENTGYRDARFSNAQRLTKLDRNRAVVTVRDCFKEGGVLYIVMDRIEGENPHTLMEKRGRAFGINELLNCFQPVFETLEEMHRHGLIHCHINPRTIIVEAGSARLVEFDLIYDTANPVRFEDEFDLYMDDLFPIEMCTDREQIGPWTDVYELAATLYYCLTGKKVPGFMDRMLSDRLTPPTSAGAKLSRKQEQALLKALAVKPEDRYQSLSAFYGDLCGNEKPMKREKFSWKGLFRKSRQLSGGHPEQFFRNGPAEAAEKEEGKATLPRHDTEENTGVTKILPPDEEYEEHSDHSDKAREEELRTVGWLVCTGGGDLGKKFKIHSEYNYVGREKGDIIVQGDPKICAEKHMLVTFDPEIQRFYVCRFNAGTVLVNGEETEGAAEIGEDDVISTGDSSFQLICAGDEKEQRRGSHKKPERSDRDILLSFQSVSGYAGDKPVHITEEVCYYAKEKAVYSVESMADWKSGTVSTKIYRIPDEVIKTREELRRYLRERRGVIFLD